MISEVIMPKLGQTMEEGRVVEWYLAEGDEVKRGDLLYTLESDKASLDVEATGRGWLRKIVIDEDEVVPVLTVVALITTDADESIEAWSPTPVEPGTGIETAPPDDAATPVGAEPTAAAVDSAPSIDSTGTSSSPGRLIASPRARRLAAERGVDLTPVTGSGPGGRIVEADVLVAAAGVPDTGAGGDGYPRADLPVTETIPLTGLRGIIAERMTLSARTIPQVTLTTEVDAFNLREARQRLRSVEPEWGFAPGYTELIAFLTVRALAEHPGLNARLSADHQAIEMLAPVNLGVATDTERGLMVPVITGAESMDLRTFTTRARELITRAREGTALPDDLAGSTFTVTSLGAFGIDVFTPLINPPEAAIMGIGRIKEKPVVTPDGISTRPLLTLSLVFDHRIVDGAPAARFLQRTGELIENPDTVFDVIFPGVISSDIGSDTSGEAIT